MSEPDRGYHAYYSEKGAASVGTVWWCRHDGLEVECVTVAVPPAKPQFDDLVDLGPVERYSRAGKLGRLERPRPEPPGIGFGMRR